MFSSDRCHSPGMPPEIQKACHIADGEKCYIFISCMANAQWNIIPIYKHESFILVLSGYKTWWILSLWPRNDQLLLSCNVNFHKGKCASKVKKQMFIFAQVQMILFNNVLCESVTVCY